jgi:hypothetical protein
MTTESLITAILRKDIEQSSTSAQTMWTQAVNGLGGLDPVVQKLATAAKLLQDAREMVASDRVWCVVEADDGFRYALNTPSIRAGSTCQLQDEEEDETDIYFDIVVKNVLGYWLTSDEADSLLERGEA